MDALDRDTISDCLVLISSETVGEHLDVMGETGLCFCELMDISSKTVDRGGRVFAGEVEDLQNSVPVSCYQT